MILIAGFAGFILLDGPWNVIAIVGAGFVEVGETYLWIRFLRRYRIRTGAEGLIGARAEVVEPCEPVGSVKLLGEIWSARSDPPAPLGVIVEVTGVVGLVLEVIPARDRGDSA